MQIQSGDFKKNWQRRQRKLHKSGVDCGYLYVHLEADTGNIFYVGKGHTPTRPWEIKGRSKDHKERAAKHGIKIELITDSKHSAEMASAWEKWWIAACRTAGFDLVNLTDGGEGTPGYRHTEETLIVLSLLKKGKPSPRKGIPHSKETRDEISRIVTDLWKDPEYARHMSESHVGYVPSQESIEKNRQAALDWWKNATEEQINDRLKKLGASIAAVHANRSSEQKLELSKKLSSSGKIRASKETPDQKRAREEKRQATLASKSESEKELSKLRRRLTRQARTSEQNEETSRKLSASLHAVFEKMSPDQRAQRGQNIAAGKERKNAANPEHWSNRLTEQEKFDIGLLIGTEKFIANLYGVSAEVVDKLRATFENKLGIPRRKSSTGKNRLSHNPTVINYREEQLKIRESD